MRASKFGGNRVLNGTFGTVWLDGEEIFEIESFEATISFEREDITMAGNLDQDSKITGQVGEGTFTVKKVFSRGFRKFMQMTKDGKDVRSQLIGLLADPDTVEGQQERVSIDNVWFDEFTLMAFEVGSPVEQEFPFGFTPSSAEIIDTIDVN